MCIYVSGVCVCVGGACVSGCVHAGGWVCMRASGWGIVGMCGWVGVGRGCVGGWVCVKACNGLMYVTRFAKTCLYALKELLRYS